jgi:hypothetical protein
MSVIDHDILFLEPSLPRMRIINAPVPCIEFVKFFSSNNVGLLVVRDLLSVLAKKRAFKLRLGWEFASMHIQLPTSPTYAQ